MGKEKEEEEEEKEEEEEEKEALINLHGPKIFGVKPFGNIINYSSYLMIWILAHLDLDFKKIKKIKNFSANV